MSLEEWEWQGLAPKSIPLGADQKSEEDRKWNRFRFPLLVREDAPITHMAFHPELPHNVAVCAGPRIHFYDGRFPSSEPLKTISKFHGSSFGVCFRGDDGRMIASGSEEGRVMVFDEETRHLVKQFKGHSGPVRAVTFGEEKTALLSGGDDCSVRRWDVPTEQQLSIWRHHSDSVRSVIVPRATPSLFVSCAYDKKIVGVDARVASSSATSSESKVQFEIALPNAVEQILAIQDGAMFAAANGTSVSVFDARSFKSPLATLSNHAKTVTCIATAFGQTRLLSGSADRTVKVWNLEDHSFECLLTHRFGSAVLSVGMSPSDTFFVAGLADGVLSLQHRPPQKSLDIPDSSSIQKSVWNTKRGPEHLPQPGDFIAPTNEKRQHKSEADTHLRKFRYADALTAALKETPATTIAMFQELSERGVLGGALGGRDDESLVVICEFLYKHITHPYFSRVCSDVLDTLVDTYCPVLNQSRVLRAQLRRIREKIEDEVKLQMVYEQVTGQVDVLLCKVEEEDQRKRM